MTARTDGLDDIDARFVADRPESRTAELPVARRRRTRSRRSSYSFLAPLCVIVAIVLTVVAVTLNLLTLASSLAALAALALVLVEVWLYRIKHYLAFVAALVLAVIATYFFHLFRQYIGVYTLGSVAVYLGLIALIVLSGKRNSVREG